MGNDPMAREDVLQLLRETECPEEFTRQFTAAMDQESIAGQLRLHSHTHLKCGQYTVSYSNAGKPFRPC